PFFPYQLRGLAWMARAQAVAAGDRRGAAELARKAASDFDESVRRGTKASAPYAEQARQLVARWADPAATEDPRLVEAEQRIKELRALRDQKAAPEILLEKCEAAAALLPGTAYEGEWRLLRTNAFQARVGDHTKSAGFRSA